MKKSAEPRDGCTVEETLASMVYARFARSGVSKAVAAQYLAERLQTKLGKNELTADDLRARLPKYLIEAIDYVTGV